MKFTTDRPYANPKTAARKLVEIANAGAGAGRSYFIELINSPFLSEHKGTSAEYRAGLDLAIDRGWLSCMNPGLTEVHASRRGVVRVMAKGWKLRRPRLLRAYVEDLLNIERIVLNFKMPGGCGRCRIFGFRRGRLGATCDGIEFV
jgi:hypothetical protein